MKYWKIFAYIIATLIIISGASAVAHPIATEKQPVLEAKINPEFIEMMRPGVSEKNNKNGQLSSQELKEIIRQAGFRGKSLRQAWAVAMKESTGRPRSHNKNSSTGDNSYGLFQINMIGDLGAARRDQFNLKTNKDLFDPVRNAKIAYFMSDGGKNWSAWNGITTTTLEWMAKFPR